MHGAAGEWATAVDSVNSLVGDLLRPMNEVARVVSAVADGDLGQQMALEVHGVSVQGEFELGSFQAFSPIHLIFLEQIMLSIGVVFNMISASRRTEELLEELKRSNSELERRSMELEDRSSLLEVKNREIAEASASLEEKARQLALVSKYKSEFLANMSHELRTPLNSVLILSNLLVDSEERNLTDKQLEYARTIFASGKDLLALISQILDLSKIEAGRMEIERSRLPLAELRSYVERSFRPMAEEKGLQFDVAIAANVPPAVTTDPQRLQQILKNLLSNAFKFTQSGHVALEVTLAGVGAVMRDTQLRERPLLAFAVSDTGIGVSADKQDLIFEAFQQADASTSRVYGGTGLGLTISRELARLLGGELQLRSVPGAGSTFTLFLPLIPGDMIESANESGGATSHDRPRELQRAASLPEGLVGSDSLMAARPRLSTRKILVVDDDVRNLFAVTSLLERHRAVVVPASSAREALEALEREPGIELVLMDIMMPEMDGYEATQRIRSRPDGRALPIIALTAKALPGDRERCLEAGCNDFIAKPIESDRLLEAIEQWLPGSEPVRA